MRLTKATWCSGSDFSKWSTADRLQTAHNKGCKQLNRYCRSKVYFNRYLIQEAHFRLIVAVERDKASALILMQCGKLFYGSASTRKVYKKIHMLKLRQDQSVWFMMDDSFSTRLIMVRSVRFQIQQKGDSSVQLF